MHYVLAGIFAGFVYGIVAFFMLFFIFCLIEGLYNKIKTGDFFITDNISLTVATIGAVLVVCFWIGFGIWTQCSDKWVDFYDDEGNITETYQIEYYIKSNYRDRVDFHLKDGRVITKENCIYNVRFEED